MSNKLIIPVCYSFDTSVLDCHKKEPYMPVACGDFENADIQASDKSIDGNVSKYNKYINEMSLIWWMANNKDILDNYDYIGLAHYRRNLNFDLSQLNENIVICNAESLNFSVIKQLLIYHDEYILNKFLFKFKNSVSQNVWKKFISYLNQTLTFKHNIFVMPNVIFKQYSKFINACISISVEIIENEKKYFSVCSTYNSRVLAFMLERMTGFFIYQYFMEHNFGIYNAKIDFYNIKSPYQRTDKEVKEFNNIFYKKYYKNKA